MREAEEVKVSGFPRARRSRSRTAHGPKLDQTGLLGVKLQAELGKALLQFHENCSASWRCSNPTMKSSATAPRSPPVRRFFLQRWTHRSST